MELKNLTIAISFVMLFSIHGHTKSQEIQLLTPEQVNNEILNKTALVFDVNPVKIYIKKHVPGAKNISLRDAAKSLPQNKSTRLIFYCMNKICMASHQAAKAAQGLGYTNVARMPLGIAGWIAAKLPTESVSLN